MSLKSISSITSFSGESAEEPIQKKPRQKPKWQATVSEDWLREVNQSRKDSLTLNGLQFCRSWTLQDALRDLIQNAIDSMYQYHKKMHTCKRPRVALESPCDTWEKETQIISKIFIECEKSGRSNKPAGFFIWTPPNETHQGPVISIINLNSKFTTDALCIGSSTKGAGDAGGHGEGLKAALTVAVRTDHAFEIFQSGVALTFIKGRTKVSYRVLSPANKALLFRSLTKDLQKKFMISCQEDVIVHLGNNPTLRIEEFQDAIKRFLFLTHRHPQSVEVGTFPVVNRRETKSGRALLLGDEFAGKVFAVGIYFKRVPGYQTLYGVDFIKSDALSRDRNDISHQNYLLAMGSLISELLEENPEFADIILAEFRQAEKMPKIIQHLELLAECASGEAKKNVINAYKKKPENIDVTYIVSGSSAELPTDNTIVPYWCDVQACRVVLPVLFDLISDGYPTASEIKKKTAEKLSACPLSAELTDEMRAWLRQRLEFFNFFDNTVIDHVEVRGTEDALDVPYAIIQDDPLLKIIFSEQAVRLRQSNPRQFLDIANKAFDEVVEMGYRVDASSVAPAIVEKQTPILARGLQDIEFNMFDDLGFEELGLDFQNPRESDFVVPDLLSKNVQDGNDQDIENLEKGLTHRITCGSDWICCTEGAYREWVRDVKPSVELLTRRSISACQEALGLLTSEDIPLNFYIDPESRIQGYASLEGIRINLRSVLLDQEVEECTLKAYFDVLIAHEYAHYVRLDDGHGEAHGARCERNMQLLMQEARRQHLSK